MIYYCLSSLYIIYIMQCMCILIWFLSISVVGANGCIDRWTNDHSSFVPAMTVRVIFSFRIRLTLLPQNIGYLADSSLLIKCFILTLLIHLTCIIIFVIDCVCYLHFSHNYSFDNYFINEYHEYVAISWLVLMPSVVHNLRCSHFRRVLDIHPQQQQDFRGCQLGIMVMCSAYHAMGPGSIPRRWFFVYNAV